MLNVTQFMRFVSLDGVDWLDPAKSEKLYVGKAIIDFMALTRGPNDLQPVKKETVLRVLGSAVLKMYDENYIALPRAIADEGTPIIINNACCSWHELAGKFMFCNSRAYVGTLFPVATSEAEQIVVKLLGKHFDKPLPLALWSAQREAYGESARRPYVVAGVYPQRLRVRRHDVPKHLATRVSRALTAWRANMEKLSPAEDGRKRRVINEAIKFYEDELVGLQRRYGS